MYEFSPIEFILRAIPEGFLLTFAVYAFSKSYINKKNYILSSILMSILTYAIKFLPIVNYGVNTILSLMALIILSISINKIDIIKSIQGSIVSIILQFTCEGINVLIIQYLLKVDMEYVFSNNTLKILYGTPSLLIFTLIVILYYSILIKRRELKNV